MRQLLAAGFLALGLTGLSACESTQTQSARLSKHAAKLATVKGQTVTQASRSVSIVGTSLLRGEGGVTAVVALRNTTARPLAGLPIEIDVNDANGRTMFKNDAAGLEPSLAQVPVLEPGKLGYWVNDQILGGSSGAAVKAVVGDSKQRVVKPLPGISLSAVHLQKDPANGIEAVGIVRNDSSVQQTKLIIYAVAMKGSRIVAAGRAGVPLLPPATKSAKPVHFAIFFAGDPTGARLVLTAPPTVLG